MQIDHEFSWVIHKLAVCDLAYLRVVQLSCKIHCTSLQTSVFPRIEAPASVSRIMSDLRPVFEAWPVFKAWLVLVHPHYDKLMVTLCVFHRNNKHVKMLVIGSDWRSDIRKPKYWLLYILPWCTLMTHRQCIPIRLDQYVNNNPGSYSRPDLYLRPGLYSRKCGN